MPQIGTYTGPTPATAGAVAVPPGYPIATTGQYGILLAPAASAGFTPANPTATTSTSLVMMGLGSTCAYTPLTTGIVLVSVSYVAFTATAAVAVTSGGRYGTGSAPANAAAVTGTRFGAAADSTVTAAAVTGGVGLSLTARLQLVPGTAYWFDIAAATAAGADAATITTVGMTIAELLA